MAELTCRFVRPDRLLFEGTVNSVVLATLDGELGILPGHAPEICALGSGVVRLNSNLDDSPSRRILVSGGYAEVGKDFVLVLANHARDIDDIDVDEVKKTRKLAEENFDKLPEHDSRRAYYQGKIDWCDLLLKHANDVFESQF